jgi:hypothetical protein
LGDKQEGHELQHSLGYLQDGVLTKRKKGCEISLHNYMLIWKFIIKLLYVENLNHPVLESGTHPRNNEKLAMQLRGKGHTQHHQ